MKVREGDNVDRVAGQTQQSLVISRARASNIRIAPRSLSKGFERVKISFKITTLNRKVFHRNTHMIGQNITAWWNLLQNVHRFKFWEI